MVSGLGFGAGGIGEPSISEGECEHLLNSIVDTGITLIDTARSYGLSEERIGRHLKHRRKEIVLSTKIGYGIPGYKDWTPSILVAGIDHALTLLQTDCIDIVHLHSCPLEVLMQQEILDAFLGSISAGKVRVCAYSGDNEPLDWAIQSGKFGSVQTSVNVCDQRVIQFLQTTAKGKGVIAKRALANAPWRDAPSHGDQAAEEYKKRWKIMGFRIPPEEAADLALRFTAFLPGVNSSLVGSIKLNHILENVKAFERGPLPDETVDEILKQFQAFGKNWPGMI